MPKMNPRQNDKGDSGFRKAVVPNSSQSDYEIPKGLVRLTFFCVKVLFVQETDFVFCHCELLFRHKIRVPPVKMKTSRSRPINRASEIQPPSNFSTREAKRPNSNNKHSHTTPTTTATTAMLENSDNSNAGNNKRKRQNSSESENSATCGETQSPPTKLLKGSSPCTDASDSTHGSTSNSNNSSSASIYEAQISQLKQLVQSQQESIQQLRKQLFTYTNNLSDLQLDLNDDQSANTGHGNDVSDDFVERKTVCENRDTIPSIIHQLFLNIQQFANYPLPNPHAQQLVTMAQRNIEQFLRDKVDFMIDRHKKLTYLTSLQFLTPSQQQEQQQELLQQLQQQQQKSDQGVGCGTSASAPPTTSSVEQHHHHSFSSGGGGGSSSGSDDGGLSRSGCGGDDEREQFQKSVQLFADMSWIIVRWVIDLSRTKIGEMFRASQKQPTMHRKRYLGYYGEFDSEDEDFDPSSSSSSAISSSGMSGSSGSGGNRAGNVLLNMLVQRWKLISEDIVSKHRLEESSIANYLTNLCLFEKELKSAGYNEFVQLMEFFLDAQKRTNIDQYLRTCFESGRYERYCSRAIDLGRFEGCVDKIYRDLVPRLSGMQYEVRVTLTTKMYNYIRLCLDNQLQAERKEATMVDQSRSNSSNSSRSGGDAPQHEDNMSVMTTDGESSCSSYDCMIQSSIDHWFSSVNEHYDYFGQCMPIFNHLITQHHIASKYGLKVVLPMMQLILTQIEKLNLRTRRMYLEMVEQFVKRIHDDFNTPTERLQFVTEQIGRKEFAQFLLNSLWIPIHEAHGDKDSPFGQNGYNFDWHGYHDMAEREHRQSILHLIKSYLPQLSTFLSNVVNVLQSASSFTVSGSFENDAKKMIDHLEALRAVYTSVGRSNDWLNLLGRVISTQKKRVTASRALVEYRDGLSKSSGDGVTHPASTDWFSSVPELL